MPPSLSTRAEPALQEMLRSLLGKLAAKVEALYHLQRQPRGNMIEVPGGDMSSFWMLSTISTATASLIHYANTDNCHPEQLFDRLMMLAGGLMAFSKKFTLTDLPRYEHEHPAPGFFALNSIIRELLDTVLSSKYFTIPLTLDKERSQYHQGQLDATLSDSKVRLYIAVNANMPALSLVSEIPRQFKIASSFDIEALVRSAMPGIQLLHMAQVPMEVPVRPNTYYFSIENRGERYDAMLKAQAIAIYAPNTIDDLRIELFAITS